MEHVTRYKCQMKGCPFVSTIEAPVCEDHLQQIGQVFLETRSVAGTFLALRDELSRKREAELAEIQARAMGDSGFVETVYYVRISDHIKIGTTNDLARRLRVLYADHDPKLLLGVEPGGRAVEQHRHLQFSDERVWQNRELFNPSPRLLEHIAEINARYGLPRAA